MYKSLYTGQMFGYKLKHGPATSARKWRTAGAGADYSRLKKKKKKKKEILIHKHRNQVQLNQRQNLWKCAKNEVKAGSRKSNEENVRS
jgi:hypothetical protein